LPTRLLVLRHAKSDWSVDYGADRDRPLAPRGVEAAKLVGRFVSDAGLAPDLVLSSPAERARATAGLAAAAGSWGAPVEIREDFYSGGRDAVLGALREVAPRLATVVVVGHEPVWSSVISGLAGGGRIRFPTAAVACLTSETGWSDLGWGRMELRWLVTPKLLTRSGSAD
jgi:phosphohistidine phosphatase